MLPILLVVAVAGSAALSSVRPPSLDAVEYTHVVQLTVTTTEAVHGCKGTDKLDISELKFNSDFLFEYETNLSNSDTKLVAAKEIKFLVDQFANKKDFSVRYCQHKLSEVQSVSRTLARAMGGRHTFDICDSDFSERVSLYEESFNKGLISKEEFDELIEDIRHIAKTDKSSCSAENSVKIDQAMKIIGDLSKVSGMIP